MENGSIRMIREFSELNICGDSLLRNSKAMIGQKLAVQDQLAQENAKLKELAEHKDRLISTLGKDRDVLLYRLKENKDAASNNGQAAHCANSAADRAMTTSFSEWSTLQ